MWSKLWLWSWSWMWLWEFHKLVPSNVSICMELQFEWDRTFRHKNIEQYKFVRHLHMSIYRLFVRSQQNLQYYNPKSMLYHCMATNLLHSRPEIFLHFKILIVNLKNPYLRLKNTVSRMDTQNRCPMF